MILKPANNVTAGAVITSLTAMIISLLQANGIVVPQEVMTDLPAMMAVVVPYVWDLATGENKPQPPKENP